MERYFIEKVNHWFVINKKGFTFVLDGVQTNYTTPLRMIVNMINGEYGTEVMDEFLGEIQHVMIETLGIHNLVDKSLRKICEEYEKMDIQEFYKGLSEEEQTKFNLYFDGLDKFGVNPLYGFRNSKGIDYI